MQGSAQDTLQDSAQDPEPRLPDNPVRQSQGRPRDSGLEDRVFDAAIAIYAAGGWSSFTFDTIARQAGVGKSALYRRWSDRGKLLCETLEARWYTLETINMGNLRDDMLALGRLCLQATSGPYGAVLNHLRADKLHFTDLRLAAAPYGERMIAQARRMIRRATLRGELPAGTKPGLLIDVIVGAVNNHVSATPPRLHDRMVAQADMFIVALVDLAMRGAGASPPRLDGSGSANPPGIPPVQQRPRRIRS